MCVPTRLPRLPFLLPLFLGTGCGAPEPHEGSQDAVSPLATLEREAAFPQSFGYLGGVRELPDGTLLAADPLGLVLLRVNLDTGAADTLGGIGDGPQEYRQPDQVLPLPGDSTLLVDLGGGRLVVLDSQGIFGERMSMSRDLGLGRFGMFHPRFSDGLGGLYMQAPRLRPGGPADSAAVIRLDRSSGGIDTVATVWLPEYQSGRGASGRGRPRAVLEPRDDWAVGADGRVVVVRARDYSLEWHLADGAIIQGPPQSFDPQPLAQEDKAAFLAEWRSSGISITVVTMPGQTVDTRMRRGISGEDGPRVEDFEWPEVFPAFRTERTLVSPEGEAWVERYVPAGSPPRWEILGLDGVRRGTVELPVGCQIIGFGEERLYLVRTDDVGLKWLERHRLRRGP